MEHRAPFLNKLFVLLACIIGGCKAPSVKESPLKNILLKKNDTSLHIVNGILLEKGKPFNGTLFTVFEGSTDTAELESYFDGKEHGEWKKFYPGSIKKEKRYFTNGQKTGEYIAWWPNGQIQLDYYFVADEYEGTCKEWNEAGLLTKIMNYKNGYENGHQQWWYDNGKIKANYIIKDGRRYGLLGTKNCVNVSDSIFKY